MTLSPRSRRRRRRRRLTRTAKAVRSAAVIEAIAAAARRRRALWMALRGSPLGVVVAGVLAVTMIRRRRRRRRLEAELGPPNESAPGHRVGPAVGTPDVSALPEPGPNQGAAGDEPAQERA